MESNHEPSKINFRSDDLAVPEVLSGVLDAADELLEESDDEAIAYDHLAMPEIRMRRSDAERKDK